MLRITPSSGELMYAENCYIALYEGEHEAVRFLYFVDQHDPYVNDPMPTSRWRRARTA